MSAVVRNMLLLSLGTLCTLIIISRTSAFVPSTATCSKYTQQHSTVVFSNNQNGDSEIQNNNNNRRELLISSSMKTFAALLIGTQVGISPAFAGIDDLSMPSPDEQKRLDDEAYQERLRRKAELQKAAAQPRTYGESMKNEQTRQNDMKKQTKEERRAAMCEELGRGC